jgi:hypothetical protein
MPSGAGSSTERVDHPGWKNGLVAGRLDKETRNLIRYRPGPAIILLGIIVVWLFLSVALAGHWEIAIPFLVLAVPWYLVWRHRRLQTARGLGLIPPSQGNSDTGPADGAP